MTLDSQFKSIDIRDIAVDYGYIGGKDACGRFINEMLIRRPQDIFVDRTIIKSHKWDEVADAMFVPGHQNVEY